MLTTIKKTNRNKGIQSGKKFHFFLILHLLFIIHHSFSQSPNWLWAKGMDATYFDGGNAIVIDASGNVYTSGLFSGTVDFDPGAGTFNLTSVGANDIFISKLDASGNFVWAKAIGGINDDFGVAIVLDTSSGNVYTSGAFEGTVDFDPGAGTFNLISAGQEDIFISKLSSSGNFVWAKRIGGLSNDYVWSMALDASGNVYTAGDYEGPVDFDPGAGTYNLTGYDIFISKLDGSGNFVWAKSIDGSYDYRYFLTINPVSGDVYTNGSFFGTVDFDPGAGTFNLTSAGGTWDIFISKLDASGNFAWARGVDGTGFDDQGFSIVVDPAGSGDVYTTGFFSGTADFDPGIGTFNLTSAGGYDIFISKLDGSGNFVWAKTIGGTSDDWGQSIALDPANGDIYTTGYFTGTSDFDPGIGTFNLTSAGGREIFVSKLDNSGGFVWAEAVSGGGDDDGFSIAIGPSGKVHVTGFFESPSITFGSITLTNAGVGSSFDMYVAKLDVATGVESVERKNGISVFPNPSGGEFTININEMQNQMQRDISIYNVLGEKVYSTIINHQLPTINLNASNGIYFLRIKTENNSVTQKIIIQK